jgi:ferritin-like metal-binding protein YciE
MAEIGTQRKLFLHELGDILYVERKLADEVLPKLVKEVTDPELRRGLEKHHTQTRRHVTNVEKAFRSMGETPETETCIGFEGLTEEHDKLMSEASPNLVNAVDAGAASRTEHYEIAAYQGLLAMARALGEREVVPLLDANLKQERQALREVEKVSRRLAREEAQKTAGNGAGRTQSRRTGTRSTR